jgi:hypothetical protein
MFLAQATTQTCQSLWTPGEVVTLMTVFGSVVIGGFFAGWRSIIALKRDAALAIIAANKAQTTSEHNERRMDGVQQQLTQVALNTPAPTAPRSPVVPATFADAQLRAAAEPDCPPPTPPTP